MSEFLKYLDILIGFSMVMLIACSLVTVVTQMMTNMLNYRSQILKFGMEKLVAQLDPTLQAHAKAIAQAVVLHPLVAGWDGKGQKTDGVVIMREELVRVLLELASTSSPLPADARDALQTVLTDGQSPSDGRLPTPEELLERIERRMLVLEAAFPAAALHFRQARAIIDEADGKAVARVMTWFDETSERMSSHFAKQARTVTLIGSACVAVALPLDSVDVLHRLSSNDALRQATVQAAQKVAEKGESAAQATGDLKADIATVQGLAAQLRGSGGPAGLIGMWSFWGGEYGLQPWTDAVGRIPGIMISIALLSLGSAFWFEMLKNLLKLRPMLAAKDEQDRQERKSQISEALPAMSATTAQDATVKAEPQPGGAEENTAPANGANSILILRSPNNDRPS